MTTLEKSIQDIVIIHEQTLPDLGPDCPILNRVQFLPLTEINTLLVKEDSHCKLVLFPLKRDKNAYYKECRTIFPLAEFVSYSSERHPEYEALSRQLNFAFHVYTPISASLLAYVYNHNSSLLNEIEKKLAFKQLDENKIFSLFREVLDILNLTQDMQTICKEFALLMSRLLETENFFIYIYNDETRQLELIYSLKNIFVENSLLDFKFQNVVLEEIFQAGNAFLNNGFNYEIESYLDQSPYLIRSALVYPFKSLNHSNGLFMAINKKHPAGFSDFDLQYMQILSHPFNLIYDSVVYHERMQRLTLIDDLTSLYNFRYLRQYLTFEIQRSLRYERNLSLLFIDIDNFKTINDNFGHLVGSATLNEIGQIFSKQVRDADVIVRYGGDEFVVILPETALDGAKVIAERLRQRVESHPFSGGRNLDLNVTVSIGIASCPDHSTTPDGLLQKADAAMYAAKEESKNKIKVAS